MTIRISRLVAVGTTLATLCARGALALLPIQAVHLANLGFGQIIATATPGTVTVSPSGSRTKSGGAVLGLGFGVSAGSVAVTGDANAAYSITLPSATSMNSGGNSMTVDTFTSTPSGSGNLGLIGAQPVAIGATVHVGAGQAAAAYTGSYSVMVSYN
jgi:hypothetical protein